MLKQGQEFCPFGVSELPDLLPMQQAVEASVLHRIHLQLGQGEDLWKLWHDHV